MRLYHIQTWITLTNSYNCSLPGVINTVQSQIFGLSLLLLFASCWCVQLPVVQTVQKHLGKIIHCLPFSGDKVPELVDDKVCHSLSHKRQSLCCHSGIMEHNAPVLLLVLIHSVVNMKPTPSLTIDNKQMWCVRPTTHLMPQMKEILKTCSIFGMSHWYAK